MDLLALILGWALALYGVGLLVAVIWTSIVDAIENRDKS